MTHTEALYLVPSPKSKVFQRFIVNNFSNLPSAKDPEWSSHPGRENKTTCAIVTLANWSWFSEWQDGQVKKRGDEYEEIKQAIGHKMIEQTCKLYPQVQSNIKT